MKKQDIESIKEYINDIKEISDKLDYNTSSIINQKIVKILPIVNNELERIDNNKIDMDCPQMIISKVDTESITKENKNITEYINNRLKELVLDGFKIIDFGIIPNNQELYAFIKYTS